MMYISYTMCPCAFLFSPMKHVNACTRKLARVSEYKSHGKRTKKTEQEQRNACTVNPQDVKPFPKHLCFGWQRR